MDPISLLENFKLTPMLIIVVIIGLTQFMKMSFKLEGPPVKVVSFFLGVFLGALYFLQETLSELAFWLNLLIYGLMFGLVASGLFDMGKQLLTPQVTIIDPGELEEPDIS